MFELYKLNLTWNNKIMESRELVAEQLFGVSTVIKNLAGEVDLEIQFEEELAETILQELIKNKIPVKKIILITANNAPHNGSCSENQPST